MPEPPAAPTMPEAPQNLAATETTTTTAIITWEAPQDNGAVISGYAMTYGPVDNPAANRVDLAGNYRETELEGLTDNTQYQLSLVAYTDDGDSPPITIEFQTPEGN